MLWNLSEWNFLYLDLLEFCFPFIFLLSALTFKTINEESSRFCAAGWKEQTVQSATFFALWTTGILNPSSKWIKTEELHSPASSNPSLSVIYCLPLAAVWWRSKALKIHLKKGKSWVALCHAAQRFYSISITPEVKHNAPPAPSAESLPGETAAHSLTFAYHSLAMKINPYAVIQVWF